MSQVEFDFDCPQIVTETLSGCQGSKKIKGAFYQLFSFLGEDIAMEVIPAGVVDYKAGRKHKPHWGDGNWNLNMLVAEGPGWRTETEVSRKYHGTLMGRAMTQIQIHMKKVPLKTRREWSGYKQAA